jgi:hypothetical protein
MTSALYPYVHTRACGMSCARYSSGQKTVDGGDGDDGAGLVDGPCARSVPVAKGLPGCRLNQELSPLGFLVVSLPPLLPLAPAVVSQVPRG